MHNRQTDRHRESSVSVFWDGCGWMDVWMYVCRECDRPDRGDRGHHAGRAAQETTGRQPAGERGACACHATHKAHNHPHPSCVCVCVLCVCVQIKRAMDVQKKDFPQVRTHPLPSPPTTAKSCVFCCGCRASHNAAPMRSDTACSHTLNKVGRWVGGCADRLRSHGHKGTA